MSLSGRRCLVLGAGGFIGAALCRALCEEGAEVQGFGHLPTYPESRDRRVTWTTGEFADQVALAKAVQGQDVVFHLVGGSIPTSSNIGIPSNFHETTQSTLALLELCRSEGVGKIVFASSGGTVYGVAAELPTPETAPTNPISAYGIGKLVVEKFLALYHHLFGLEYRVLRIGNPYGRYQSPVRKQGVVAALLHRALAGRPLEIWGDGETVRDFVHIDDVADAFLRAVTYDGPHRVMNVGSGVGRSVNSVVADIAGLLGLASPLSRRPARSADVPASILDARLIREQTGWRPAMSWPEGLARTADWLRGTAG